MATSVQLTEDSKQIPVANGGVGPGYWWTQSLGDTTIYVEIPMTAASRDVLCSIGTHSLRVGLVGCAPIIDGELPGAVRPRECVWNLESESSVQHRPVLRPASSSTLHTGRPPQSTELGTSNESAAAAAVASAAAAAAASAAAAAAAVSSATATLLAPMSGRCKVLTIVLEKAVETWWPSAVVSHPEIDASLVDSTQPLDSYDADTQAAIRKVMFDEQQKRAGGPTSDELAIAALMETAKLAPGSPFATLAQPPAPPE